jgi:membrane protease YdiL (CAAX protease family)
VLLFASAGRSLADIGQSLGPRPMQTIATACVMLAAFTLLSLFTTRQLRTAKLADLPHRMRRAGKILPQTGEERAWFALVALTAGVCEEILYRGFLPWFVDAHVGVFGVGYLVAAIVFGFGHAYQGKDGMAVTAVLGLFFGAVAFFVRSLVPASSSTSRSISSTESRWARRSRGRRLQSPPLPVPAADIDAPAAPSA